MSSNVYLHIAVMALVTYAIRMLPLTLIRKEIQSPFLRSFLYYVPYVTLSVMIFPAILTASPSMASGVLALVVAVFLASRGRSMITVSMVTCVLVFLVESLGIF